MTQAVINPLSPMQLEEHSLQPPFVNEPFLNFADADVRYPMLEALTGVRSRLGQEYDLVIGGNPLRTEAKIVSINPARPAEVVGVHQRADERHVEAAIEAAQSAFATWSRAPALERAALLFRTATLVRERKLEMCAWLVYEVGKNWAEADADVGETIDFLQFYAREALRLDAATTPIQFPGERNQLRYIPLGVGAVIPPWNFPLAIMAGMTSAAIVCGNTVILKPSGDAPTIAAIFFSLLEEAGLPPGVVNFCPGAGAKFGSAIVAHPQTRFIAFTGSKAVGLEIHEAPPRPSLGSTSSSAPSSRWAARTPSLSSPTATSTPRSKASPSARSASTARSAPPARAPL
jgi:1-pyrroline-5-carboxylate dehydrogenase